VQLDYTYFFKNLTISHAVCMYVCVRTYVRTYTHTYIHTYLRTYIHTYVRTYVRVCVCREGETDRRTDGGTVS